MAKSPDFLFTYYRPWEKDSSLIKSVLDYSRDIQMSEYNAQKTAELLQKSNHISQQQEDCPRYLDREKANIKYISPSTNISGEYRPARNVNIDSEIMAYIKGRFRLTERVHNGVKSFSAVSREEVFVPFDIEDPDFDSEWIELKSRTMITTRLRYEGVESCILRIAFQNYSHYRALNGFRILLIDENDKPVIFDSVLNEFQYGLPSMPVLSGRTMLCDAISLAVTIDDVMKMTDCKMAVIQFDNVRIECKIHFSGSDLLCLLFLTGKCTPEHKKMIYEHTVQAR